MGAIELILVVVAALLLGVVVVLRRRTGGAAEPMPWLALGLAALEVVLALLVGLGLGSTVVPWLLPETGEVVLLGPHDLATAHAAGARLVGTWLALPGLCVLLWLALSRGRSIRPAAAFAAVAQAGATAGLGVGWLWIRPELLAPPDPTMLLALIHVVEFRVDGMLGLAGAGACLGMAVVTASSPRSAAIATLALPFVALGIGAVCTPPDVLSQLLMAAPVVLCWLAGVGLGAALRAVR